MANKAGYLGFGEHGFYEVDSKDYKSTYEMLQAITGGSFESVPLSAASGVPEGVSVLCDEEGKIKYMDGKPMPITGYLVQMTAEGELQPYDVLLGDLIFIRVNSRGDTRPLTDRDKEVLKNLPQTELGQLIFIY